MELSTNDNRHGLKMVPTGAVWRRFTARLLGARSPVSASATLPRSRRKSGRGLTRRTPRSSPRTSTAAHTGSSKASAPPASIKKALVRPLRKGHYHTQQPPVRMPPHPKPLVRWRELALRASGQVHGQVVAPCSQRPTGQLHVAANLIQARVTCDVADTSRRGDQPCCTSRTTWLSDSAMCKAKDRL